MTAQRLSALDASFLAVEGPNAHMHVGWAASFAPPEHGPRPGFSALFAHIASRLDRAPRYRQRLAPDALGLHSPLWVDDEAFDPAEHIHRSAAREFSELVDAVFSEPLDRSRPLWEFWIADELGNGRIGLVGKVHHCMVDGIAAVELGSMLLDLESEAVPAEPAKRWLPAPVPGAFELLARGAADLGRQQIGLLKLPLTLARKPLALPGLGLRAARTVARAALPVAPASALNGPSSSQRHLATLRRPLADLLRIRTERDATVNDVLLAAVTGALRLRAERRGEPPVNLKSMVPVNVRAEDPGALGNRISFVFVELPVGLADPTARLLTVNAAMHKRKSLGLPEGADAALKVIAHAPRPVQAAAARALASPRAYNLVVSNIPGPRVPMYLHGCRLLDAYPVVPLSEGHALSVGMTTVGEHACFGLYADPETLPDADALAADLDAAIDELLATLDRPRETDPWQRPPRFRSATQSPPSPSLTPMA